jgi:hypothetical protein
MRVIPKSRLFLYGALRKIILAMIHGNVWRVKRDKEPAMKIDIKQHTLNLADEGLLSIRDGQATRIRVQEGTLWITEEGEVKDTVLGRGEAYVIRHAGLAVLTSLGASRITVEGPAREQRSARRIAAGDVPELASCA